MNIAYRDPLFSVIIFLGLVIIVILTLQLIIKINDYRSQKSFSKFMKNFDYMEGDDIRALFQEKDATKHALLILSLAFEKEGNYEKAITIYLSVLELFSSPLEKRTVLKKLANVYFKAGFLYKSREILLEVLRDAPRDKEALKLLIVTDDKLKNYEEIIEIIDIFEELEEDIEKEYAYVKSHQLLMQNKIEEFNTLYQSHSFLQRLYIETALKREKEVYSTLTPQEVIRYIDLLWKPYKEKILEQETLPFELEVIKALPSEIAEPEFEYICTECKHIFPIHNYRCVHCREVFTLIPEIRLTKKV